MATSDTIEDASEVLTVQSSTNPDEPANDVIEREVKEGECRDTDGGKNSDVLEQSVDDAEETEEADENEKGKKNETDEERKLRLSGVFSPKDVLIEEVKKHPVMYVTDGTHNSTEQRNEALIQVHSALIKSGFGQAFPDTSSVQRRWKGLRDSFRKYVLKVNKARLQGLRDPVKQISTWHLMKFLVPQILDDYSLWDLSDGPDNRSELAPPPFMGTAPHAPTVVNKRPMYSGPPNKQGPVKIVPQSFYPPHRKEAKDQRARLHMIRTVKKYPVIYNETAQSGHYGKDLVKQRNQAWDAVLKDLQDAGLETYFHSNMDCREKWRSCRKSARLYIRATEAARETGEPEPIPNVWWKHLKFLLPWLAKKPSLWDMDEDIEAQEKEFRELNEGERANVPLEMKPKTKRFKEPKKPGLSSQGDPTYPNIAKVKLLIAVQKRPVLYDVENKFISSTVGYRMDAWMEVADELHAEGLAHIFPDAETVKQRWKNLRTVFTRWLLRVNERRKKGQPDMSQMPKFWPWLKFLVPYILEDPSHWDLSPDEQNLRIQEEPYMYISSESEEDETKIKQVTTIVMTNGGDNMPRFHAIGGPKQTVDVTTSQSGLLTERPRDKNSRKRKREESDEEGDDLDSWAKMVALQLRALPEQKSRDKLKLEIIQLVNKERYSQ